MQPGRLLCYLKNVKVGIDDVVAVIVGIMLIFVLFDL